MKVVHFNFFEELGDSKRPCSMCSKKVEEGYVPYPHTDDEYDKLTQFFKQPSEEWFICEDCLHRRFARNFHVTSVLTEGGERLRICEEILSRRLPSKEELEESGNS